MSEPQYERYVALGDSQTEGLCDGDEATGYRGWADRLAEHLAELNPNVHYANLAVRGTHAADIRRQQLEPALAMRPDLVTVVAGMNDLLRPSFDADEVAGEIEAMFAALTDAGARVATITFPKIGEIVPLARPLLPRVIALNARIDQAAARHGVAVLETYHQGVTTDQRLWSPDRLHASPLGHRLIAAGMANTLGLPGSSTNWSDPLPGVPESGTLGTAAAELRWMATFFGPWVSRRIRGKSSSDGRTAKRPELTPLRG
ncbi:SGNH/GDSL hydrolase family protein [Haloechinothrix halophila]|uniref:SGNH/GDSL hydrolase family protein n=1 Tax=Haloechinothrix halophila TaxID=1069073 RepID=UPI000409DE7B|nr:SGNH/GDSL hydrolase family protein [Haloechinothrix halophila]